MKGVFFSKAKKRWIASYTNARNGVSKVEKQFNTQNEAVLQRKLWIDRFGIPGSNAPIRDGFENEYWEVLGDTEIRTKSGSQVLLVHNKITGENKKMIMKDVLKLSGLGHGRTRHGGVSKIGSRWRAYIVIEGRQYSLGHFSNKEDAKNSYKRAFNDWVKNKKVPGRERQKSSRNSSGELLIGFDKLTGNWRFQKSIDGKNYNAEFKTFEEAKKYKQQFLESYKQGTILKKKARSNTGEKYISRVQNHFIFVKVISTHLYKKSFKNLDDAVAYKHEFLKEHGLTE